MGMSRVWGSKMIERVFRGIVHGNTIELHDKIDLADGERVEIFLRRVLSPDDRSGEGLLRTEGALADDPDWDTIMDEVHQLRKLERRPQWGDA